MSVRNGGWEPTVRGYEITGELGRGGFAVVYEAVQLSIDRPVALKVINLSSVGAETSRRFRAECKTIGRLSWHPHVVVLHDAGETQEGAPYLAMEILPAGSLGEKIDAEGPMAPAAVVRAGLEIADALTAAHEAGVIHRDIKPDNVMIGRRGEVLLGDFGIATLTDGTSSVTGSFVGSLAYTAPELLHGQRANATSDLYSAGMTLYTLAAGRAAFASGTDDTPAAIMWRVTSEEPAPLPASVPACLAELIAKATTKSPESRYRNAQAFADALHIAATVLQPTLGDQHSEAPTNRITANQRPHPPPRTAASSKETILAGPPDRPPGTTRHSQVARRRRPFALAAAGLVTLVLGMSFLMLSQNNPKEETADQPETTVAPPTSTEPTTTTDQAPTTQAATTTADRQVDPPAAPFPTTSEGSDAGDTETTTESSAPDGTTEPDGPAPAGEDAEFCATEAALDDIDDEFDPTTIEGLKAGYVALVEAAQGLGDVAPDEIADDVETVLEGLDEVGVLIADAATIEEAEAALEGFDTSEIEPASDRVDEWVEENCPDDDDDGA